MVNRQKCKNTEMFLCVQSTNQPPCRKKVHSNEEVTKLKQLCLKTLLSNEGIHSTECTKVFIPLHFFHVLLCCCLMLNCFKFLYFFSFLFTSIYTPYTGVFKLWVATSCIHQKIQMLQKLFQVCSFISIICLNSVLYLSER